MHSVFVTGARSGTDKATAEACAISEALVWELEPFGISVVSLEPGFVATGIFDRAGFGEPIDDASPYREDEAWVRRFSLQGLIGGVAPEVVANRIVALGGEDRPSLHQLVGEDAVAVAAALKASPDFESWNRAAQARVASLAGPRPAGKENSLAGEEDRPKPAN